ncbi:MAG: Mov34/MPN/PAD-1 family protein [Anaerolineae bacterium]
MLRLTKELLAKIHANGEAAYPEEGAGFMLGEDGEARAVMQLLSLPNAREELARQNRYLFTAEDYMKAEMEADRLGLSLVGVFHSHPDHPNEPSEFDRDWAQPYFSYVITTVRSGKALESRSWRLAEDRSQFQEEQIQLVSKGD